MSHLTAGSALTLLAWESEQGICALFLSQACCDPRLLILHPTKERDTKLIVLRGMEKAFIFQLVDGLGELH